MASVFEDYDFTPVQGDPFKPPARPVTPTPAASQPLQSDWIPTGSDVIPYDMLKSTPESWAGYAGNSQHPMGSRIGAGLVEEMRQYGLGLKNALETVMGPVYGQGHFPMASEGTAAGAPYAGAGLNLAAQMVSPGGEGGLAAGWNPDALKYLEGLFKQKPPLKPETAAAVNKLLAEGTEYAGQLSGYTGAPGSGIAKIAGTKHVAEEWAQQEAEEKAAAVAKAAADKEAEKALAKAAAAKPKPAPAPAPAPWTSPSAISAAKPATAAPAFDPTQYPSLGAAAKAWEAQQQAATAKPPVSAAPAALTAEMKVGTKWSPQAEAELKGKGYNPGFMSPIDAMKMTPGVNPNDMEWKAALSTHNQEMGNTAAPAPAVTPSLQPSGSLVNGWSPKAADYLKSKGVMPQDSHPLDIGAAMSSDPHFGGYPDDKHWEEALKIHNQEIGGPAAPTPAAAAPAVAPKKAKALKTPKAASTVPLTPEQALGLAPAPKVSGTPATETQLNKLFTTYVPPLQVPTMKPYNPTLTGKALLETETAPGTSGMKTPFNPDGLPMDKNSVKQRMQDLGFGPIGGQWLYWRGIKPHGPYSWDSAAVGYRDPGTKMNERGLFLAPDVNAANKKGYPIAKLYGDTVNAHVVRADNPLVVEYKKLSGSNDYSSLGMQKAIKEAWDKGHDAVLLKNINDIGGKHDQMVVKNPNQLRHPGAAFNPKYKDLPNLLAAGGLGFEVPPIVAHQQEMEDKDGGAQ